MEQGGRSRQPESGVTLVTAAIGFVGSHRARALLDGGSTARSRVRGVPARCRPAWPATGACSKGALGDPDARPRGPLRRSA